jgi:hypothetical protein
MSQVTPEGRQLLKVIVYDVPQEQEDISNIGPDYAGEKYEFADISAFEYTESIYEPFMTARVKVLDSNGQLEKAFNGCGIRQYCPVEVLLVDPAAGTDSPRIRDGEEIEEFQFTGDNCFYVTRVVNQLVRGKKQIYDIEMLSKSAILSIADIVSRKWPSGENQHNIEWNKVVEDLLLEEMKVKKELNVTVDKTEVVTVYPAHNYYPLKIINDACSKAIPLVRSGGQVSDVKQDNAPLEKTELKKYTGYAFFETYDKINYVSLDGLVNVVYSSVNIDDSHTFVSQPTNKASTTPEQERQTILSYKFNESTSTSDLISNTLTGKTGSKRINYFDLGTRKHKEVIEQFPKEECQMLPFEGSFRNMIYKVTSTYSVEYFDTCDKSVLDKVQQNDTITTLNYSAGLEDIKDKTSTVRLPGNLSLSVGDKIYLGFMKIQPDQDGNEFSDKYSGVYVITELAHRVENVKNFYTDLSVCKLKDK